MFYPCPNSRDQRPQGVRKYSIFKNTTQPFESLFRLQIVALLKSQAMKQLILLLILLSSFSLLAEDSIQTEGCKADFTFEHNPDIMTLVPGAAINFYDTSEGNVLERYWDFGDGHSSTEKNPMFVFTYPLGSPNVKLNPYRKVSLTIVTDSCKSTLTQTINIYEIADSTYQYCEAVFRYYELEKDSLSQTVKNTIRQLFIGE